jgi:hypothetical protein
LNATDWTPAVQRRLVNGTRTIFGQSRDLDVVHIALDRHFNQSRRVLRDGQQIGRVGEGDGAQQWSQMKPIRNLHARL